MTRTGQAAIDYARSRKCENCMTPGYCLQFTRSVFDVNSYYPSAIDAWNGAKIRHPGDRNPPPAVPVYFATPSVYDHVCFFVSSGEVISTFNDDIRSFAGISDVERQFGGTYLGWAEDINTVTVYTGGTDPGGEDWLSYLSYEEQRRVLAWADQGQPKLDQLRSLVDQVKPNTDRLPHIHSQVDVTASQVTNNHNGILQIIDLVKAIPVPSTRQLLIVLLLIMIAAAIGVLVAVYVSSDQAGIVSGTACLIGGLIGYLTGGIRAARDA